MPNILMFAGSARKDSLNKKLINAFAESAKAQKADSTLIDLADYPMPLYDGDYEEDNGQPENAKKLHDIIKEHKILVVTSPEYNGLPSPLLKNTIDWITRVDVKVFNGKIAAIASASPGALGGLRGLNHVRTLFTNLNVLVLPQQIAIGGASGAFDEDGMLKDAKQQGAVDAVVKQLTMIVP